MPKENVQLQNLSNQDTKKDSNKKKRKYIIIALLIIFIFASILACGLIYWFFIRGKNILDTIDEAPENEEQVDEDESVVEEENGDEENDDEVVESKVPDFWKDKIIYKDNFNLFLADKDGSDKVQLTSFAPQSSSYIVDPYLIDENLLGFGKCYYEQNGADCTIYTVNVKNQILKTVKELESGDRLVQITWDDADTYAYVLGLSNGDQWKILYNDEGNETLIDTIDQLALGRGGIMEDCMRLRFSPDGKKLFYINTAGQIGIDFTVYVYGNGSKICEIENATMPVWKDNNSIVYVYINSNNAADIGKIYEMNLTSLEFAELQGAYPGSSINFSGSFDTTYYDGRVIYWGVLEDVESEGKVQDYDFRLNTLFTKDGSWIRPVVLSEDEFILTKTIPATLEEAMMPDSFENLTGLSIEGVYVLNVNTEVETEIDVDSQYLLAGVITWYHRYLYY